MIRLLKNTTCSTAIHRASDIIRNVRTIFETLDTRLLDALCDVNTEGNKDFWGFTSSVKNDVLEMALEKKCRLTRSIVIMQVSILSITTSPPPTHPGICTKTSPPSWAFCIQAFAQGGGGGDVLGQLPRGGHLSINDVCHFWNFHYNGKNWWLTTLRGLLVALKFYTFLKKIIRS